MSDQYQEISNRLMAISEEIADLALADLRDSLEEGRQKTTPLEKRLTRARRAVEKAAYFWTHLAKTFFNWGSRLGHRLTGGP